MVLAVGSEYVTVHAGLKSESTIPVDQFRNENGEMEVAVGDRVEVALDTVEDGFGSTRLSREKAKRAKAWGRLEAAFEGEEAVTGVINGKVKVDSPSISTTSGRSCPDRWSTCVRCAIPPTSKASLWSSR